MAGARGRAARGFVECRQIAVRSTQQLTEVGRNRCITGLNVDHLVGLDNTQPQFAFVFEADNLHAAFLKACTENIEPASAHELAGSHPARRARSAKEAIEYL